MNVRKLSGIILSASAVAVAPFGYWISTYWFIVALCIGILGFILLFSGRNQGKYDPTVAADADIYAGSKELKGFYGANAFDSQDAIDSD
jgi:hypothetical protein